MSSPAPAPSLFRPLMAFLAWWGRELAGMVPASWRGIGRPVRRRIALAMEGGRLTLIDQRAKGPARVVLDATDDAAGTEQLAAALGELVRTAKKAAFGVRLPLAAGYERTLDLPRTAQIRAAEILAFDLERATPIPPERVYVAHYLGETTKDGARRTAHHIIFHRETIDGAVERLAALGIEAQFADVYRERPETPLPIDLLASAAGAGAKETPRRQYGLGLAFAAVLLALLAGYQVLRNQEAVLTGLQAQITDVQGKAIKVRKRVDASQAEMAGQDALVRRRSETPGTIQILEEITQRLPDTAWISELRVDQGKVDMAGYAKSAAGLVQVIEQSGLFEAAALSSPVTLDPRYGSEHFSVRATVTGAAAEIGETATAGAAP